MTTDLVESANDTDHAVPGAPPPQNHTPVQALRRITAVLIASVLGVLGVLRVFELLDRPEEDDEAMWPAVLTFDFDELCLDPDDLAREPAITLGDAVECLERTDSSTWPVGLFDIDGRGYLVSEVDGAVALQHVPLCRRDQGPATSHPTVVESLGWEFRTHGDGSNVEFALPGFGGPSGLEPGPEDPLPDSWQGDGLIPAVFALHYCGMPLERAVALIEPQAGG